MFMATAEADTLDSASLRALLGPQLTAEQAALIFQQGQEAVVFALLTLAKQLAETHLAPSACPDPSTPSGQTPPYAKPAGHGRSRRKGAKPGQSRSAAADADADRPSRAARPGGLPQLSRIGDAVSGVAHPRH